LPNLGHTFDGLNTPKWNPAVGRARTTIATGGRKVMNFAQYVNIFFQYFSEIFLLPDN
jgi:hypothetical protein